MEFFNLYQMMSLYQMASDITLWFTLNTAENIALFTGNLDYAMVIHQVISETFK
jgi:hypothetical protein